MSEKTSLKYIVYAFIPCLFVYGTVLFIITKNIMLAIFNTIFFGFILYIIFIFIYLLCRYLKYFIFKRFKFLPPKKRAEVSAKLVIGFGTLATFISLFFLSQTSIGFFDTIFYGLFISLFIISIFLSVLQLMGIPTIEKIQARVRRYTEK